MRRFASLVLLLANAFSTPAQAPVTISAFTRWRMQIRRALFIPEALPPLEARVWSSFRPMPGVLADRVTYRTGDGMLVPAIVYRPEKTKGKVPGIVIVNGHGGDKYSWYAFYSGMMFAQAGAEVVTYDPIGEGERNLDRRSRAGSHDGDVTPPAPLPHDDWGQHLAGLMQVDVMQAVSYLASRPAVDSRRIAIVGYSLGAFVGGIAGALDPRVHAVLLSGGGTFDDAEDGGKSYDAGTLPCQSSPWHALKVLGEGAHHRGAILYALNAESGPMLVENGSDDTVMDIPHRGPAWFEALRAQAVTVDQAAGSSAARMFTTHVDAGKSHRPAWLERYGVAWLNQQLHFTRWSAAQIESMPQTHIAEWLATQQIPWAISNGYLRDDREGGLLALGVAIPGLRHQQLDALPVAVWSQLKPQLTYEAWAVKVSGQEQAAALALRR